MLETQCTYLKYLDKVATIIDGSDLSAENLLRLRENITRTEILVPVIGAFNAGKSSLLNAFLGQEILNIGLTPETELATELRFSPDPYLLAVREDGSSERLPASDITTIKSRAGEFTHLQLYLDNPSLEKFSSLVLVDMPGFGSSLINHNNAIAYYLPRGAFYIVVISIEDGNITNSMMRQLDDLQSYGRGFTFVINKINLRSDEQTDEVAEEIDAQIAYGFTAAHEVVRVGWDGKERLAEILTALDPEKIFRNLFLDQLKDLTHSLLDQINLALMTLKNNQAEAEYTLHELKQGMHRVREKRDSLIAKMHDHEIERTVEHCLSAVDRDLAKVLDELVSAALSSDKESCSRIISEVVRSALTRTVQEQLTVFSRTAISELGNSLNGIGKNIGIFSNDKNWVTNLTDRISRGMQKTGEILGNWSNALAERNQKEMERSEQEENRKKDSLLPRLGSRGLVTALMLTTNIVNPIVELAIIFLPDILNFFTAGRQKTQLKKRLLTEVIPATKRQIRDKLPALLDEQIQALIAQISEEFERDLAEKTSIIDKISAEHTQDRQNSEKKTAHLNNMLGALQKLASQTLYKEARI
ncbi:dynamin-like GTPase family protein [Komagataeibacter kakiaceti JCM 25156]|uniref:dynamin family protein n=1 Tax=Komagataeibacter kakiaceti TaxID=943261 RepID=UPI000471C2CC|nr:dynamin family protein [Komagataeibacter kakiaceti]